MDMNENVNISPEILDRSGVKLADSASRVAWVKPTLERLSLKEALTGPVGSFDNVSHDSSS